MDLADDRICFHSFLMPKMLLSEQFQTAPLEARPKILGPSYQLDQCAAPEILYGKTILEINPDSSENFVMLKH